MLQKRLFGMSAIIVGVMLVFSLMGCDNGTTGGNPDTKPDPQSITYVSKDSNGNLYTLEITEDTSSTTRYAAKQGDFFKLTVELYNDGDYTVALSYEGRIGNTTTKSTTEIEINISVNNKPLTITISGTEMTLISGEIVNDNGETVVETPETLNGLFGLFNIGDIGPGGGIVFYVNQAGFTMTDDNSVCHHLEVSPTVISNGSYVAFLMWASPSCFPPTDSSWAPPLPGGTGDWTDIMGTANAIGTGRKNTALILAIDSQAPAAKACSDYRLNGKDGWFLPSKDELNELYLQRSIVPGLNEYATYWSSTQSDITDALCQDFHPDNGGRILNQPKFGEHWVYAIRAF